MRDYLTRTDTTAIYPSAGTGSLDALVYVALGLTGESSEVMEKELAGDAGGVCAELGDVSWYLARLHRELGCDPAPVYEHALTTAAPAAAGHLIVPVGRIAELLKKAMRDDASILSDERRQLLGDLLAPTVTAWVGVHRTHGIDPAHTLGANIAKLTDRKRRNVLAGSGDHR